LSALTGFCLALLATAQPLDAQVRQGDEIGLMGGITYAFTDINNTFDQFPLTREGYGIFYRRNFHHRWSFRAGLNGGLIQGQDALSQRIFENRRNLSYRNRVYDAYGQIEFNFLDKPKRHKYGSYVHFTPFLGIGLGLTYHNPQAMLNGQWVDLRPLGTEGQNFSEVGAYPEPYTRIAINVPISGGLKYYFAKHWAVGMELSWRKVFTDYLDDVSGTYVDRSVLLAGQQGNLAATLADRSNEGDMPGIGYEGLQRGDDSRNDQYAFFGISISYVFAQMVCPSPGRGSF
jgi:hypothetical protein